MISDKQGELRAMKRLYDRKYEKACNTLVFICILLYVFVMASKNVYTAEIIEIIDVFNTTRAKASVANTLYYITYAAVQVILFFCFDKINLKRFLSVSLAGSAALTLVIAALPEDAIWRIWLVFAVNGCLQAGAYAGVMLIFAKFLPSERIAFANKLLSSASVGANVLSYIAATVSVSFFGWRAAFIGMGALFAVSVIIFAAIYPRCVKIIKSQPKLHEEPKNAATVSTADFHDVDYADIGDKKKKTIFYVMLLTGIFFANALHFAVNNWFSDILYNVYGVPKNFSMLISIAVPIVILSGPVISISYGEKHQNVMAGALLFFAASIVFPIYMIFFYDLNLIVTIVVLLVYLIMINGGRVFFSSIMAFRMRRSLNAGAYSAITNASASVAAGVAPTIIGFIADLGGWGVSFFSLFIIHAALIGIIALTLFVFGKTGITARKKENITNKNKAAE